MIKYFLCYLFLCLLSPAIAHEYKVNKLIIDHPIARETPPGIKVGAGYLSITNNSDQDEILISATGELAAEIQIHTIKVQNDIMKMVELTNGLTIPAGETVTLQPGGLHLMFMSLKQQLIEGDEYSVNLKFKNAGEIEVLFNVEKIEFTETSSKNNNEKTSDHKHSHLKH